MRKIPTTMATQHPDNASSAYWHGSPFVGTADEIEECYTCFSDLSIDEYNWDWEGKYVDEAVIDRLLHTHFRYFKKQILGKDKFLTFRIPNPRVEKQFRLARAFMVVITSSQLAQSLGFKNPPIFETILPLTETAEEIVEIQEAFKNLVAIDHRLLKMKESIKNIEIIPLFEQVGRIITSAKILGKYLDILKKEYDFVPSYLRPYLARSDPALNSGLVPTMLALKVALSSYGPLEQKTGVKLFPMVGTGSLPFRGGVSPDYIDETLAEYAGVSTLTVQSAFRYDYDKKDVRKAILKLKKELPKGKTKILPLSVLNAIPKTISFFERPYRQTVEKLSAIINTISYEFPKRRERLQHIGLFGYSRGIGKVKLPRAIPFTGALYSLGIPPEIIGTGRGIRQAKLKGYWDIVSPVYSYLKNDLIRAGYFLNKENVSLLSQNLGGLEDLQNDIAEIEKEFNIELGPKNNSHFEHYNIVKKIRQRIKNKKSITEYITKAGIIRKSLG